MVATPMGDGDAEVEDDDGEVDGKSATGEMEGGDGGATGATHLQGTERPHVLLAAELAVAVHSTMCTMPATWRSTSASRITW